MIAIITQEQGIAQAIAQIPDISAKEKNGYLEGGGYLITWTGGQLLELSIPKETGAAKSKDGYPALLPESFKWVPRKIKTAKGYRTDPSAVKQLDIIRRVFCRCDSIIDATGSEDRGGPAFSRLYRYLGSTKPFSRLWLTALTGDSLRQGLKNLRDGRLYDNLHLVADARLIADKLMEVYAGGAMREATGGQYTITREGCKHPCWP